MSNVVRIYAECTKCELVVPEAKIQGFVDYDQLCSKCPECGELILMVMEDVG